MRTILLAVFVALFAGCCYADPCVITTAKGDINLHSAAARYALVHTYSPYLAMVSTKQPMESTTTFMSTFAVQQQVSQKQLPALELLMVQRDTKFLLMVPAASQ